MSESEIRDKYSDEQLLEMGDKSPLFKYTPLIEFLYLIYDSITSIEYSLSPKIVPYLTESSILVTIFVPGCPLH